MIGQVLLLTMLWIISSQILESSQKYRKIELKRDRHTFTTEIYIGTPGQKQIVTIDTGSEFLIVKETSCTSCTHNKSLPFFNQKDSTSFSKLNCRSETNYNYLNFCKYQCPRNILSKECHFQAAYGMKGFNSTFSGLVGVDNIDFSQIQQDKQRINYAFVCGTKYQQIGNKIQFNGIMGLQSENKLSIMFGLYERLNITKRRKFSMCLQDSRGFLQFGQLKQEHDKSKTIVKYSEKYYIHNIQQFSIGSVNLLDSNIIEKYGILIDSGSSMSVFPTNYFNKIETIFNEVCESLDQICIQLQNSKKSASSMNDCYGFSTLQLFNTFQQYVDKIFPEIIIKINQTYLNMLPSQYLDIQIDQTAGIASACYYFGISQNQYILGSSWLVNKKIIFHIDEKYMEIFDNYPCFQEGLFAFSFEFGQKWYKIAIWTIFVAIFCLFIYCNVRRNRARPNKLEELQLNEVGSTSVEIN